MLCLFSYIYLAWSSSDGKLESYRLLQAQRIWLFILRNLRSRHGFWSIVLQSVYHLRPVHAWLALHGASVTGYIRIVSFLPDVFEVTTFDRQDPQISKVYGSICHSTWTPVTNNYGIGVTRWLRGSNLCLTLVICCGCPSQFVTVLVSH